MTETNSESGNERWVHATNAADYGIGGRQIIGWRDESSPTGWLSGIVVETDPNALRVRVRDIMPGIVK